MSDTDNHKKEHVMSDSDEFEFANDLAAVLNKHSMEDGSNTPDYVLAQFLIECLQAWNAGIGLRAAWQKRISSGTDWEKENLF
jgi:hypothetical protein